RAGEMGRLRQLREGLERPSVLDVARLHAEIHAAADPDPDGRRLPARASGFAEHPVAQVHPGGDVRPGRDRPRGIESPLVLAVQLQFRPGQPLPGRPRNHSQAARLVRRGCRPRPVGGDRIDCVEGAWFRDAALCSGHPGDSPRDDRGGHGRRRLLLAAHPHDHLAAHLPHDPSRYAGQRHRLAAGLRSVLPDDRRSAVQPDGDVGLLDLSELVSVSEARLRRRVVAHSGADHPRLHTRPDDPDAAEPRMSAGVAFARDLTRPTAPTLAARLWRSRSTYLAGAVCMAVSAVMLAPLVLSVSASLKTTEEASAIPPTYLTHL